MDGATPVVILACERPSAQWPPQQWPPSDTALLAQRAHRLPPISAPLTTWKRRPGAVLGVWAVPSGSSCGLTVRCVDRVSARAEPLTRLGGPSHDVPLGAGVPCTCRGKVGPAVFWPGVSVARKSEGRQPTREPAILRCSAPGASEPVIASPQPAPDARCSVLLAKATPVILRNVYKHYHVLSK